MNPTLLLAIPLLPLIAAIIAGFFGKAIGRAGAHSVTIAHSPRASRHTPAIAAMLQSGPVKRQ